MPLLVVLSVNISDIETLTFLVVARLAHPLLKNRLGALANARIEMASKSCAYHSAELGATLAHGLHAMLLGLKVSSSFCLVAQLLT